MITVTLIDEQDAAADLDLTFNGKSHEITEADAYAIYHKIGFALQEISRNRTQAAIEAAYEPTPEEVILL